VYTWSKQGVSQCVRCIIGNPSAALSQTVSSRRGPIYRARIYVNPHVMGQGNAYLVMGICIFGYARIRARWIGPLRLTECFVGISRNVRHPFCEYAMRHRKLGVTCLFCGCYVFRKQKGGFCNIKTPFLYAKNPLFALQKPYF